MMSTLRKLKQSNMLVMAHDPGGEDLVIFY